jgi:coenzyme F420 hydrogenase subunit delta
MSSFDRDDLPDYLKRRVVIVGVGNSLLGDDGFGPATIQLILRNHDLPSSVCALDVGTAVMPVLMDMLLSDLGPKRLIILDTVDVGKKPGELIKVPVEQLPQTSASVFSFHIFSARRVLQELKDRRGIEVVVLACQVECITSEIQEGLSKPVEEAVCQAARIVLELARA